MGECQLQKHTQYASCSESQCGYLYNGINSHVGKDLTGTVTSRVFARKRGKRIIQSVRYFSEPVYDQNVLVTNSWLLGCSSQVGENGAGKTTLLKLLLGNLDPVKGIRHVHRNLKIGYFTQHHVDQLDMSQSSVELLASGFPGELVVVSSSSISSRGCSRSGCSGSGSGNCDKD